MTTLTQGTGLSAEELASRHAYWRAANYLSLGQIDLKAKPLVGIELLEAFSRADA